MPPATVNFGCAPPRLSVTVRISRAASTDSFASVVPGTAQRAASKRLVFGSLANCAGTSAGATSVHAAEPSDVVRNQRPDASR